MLAKNGASPLCKLFFIYFSNASGIIYPLSLASTLIILSNPSPYKIAPLAIE
jgi:hypothetical protein